ncbi:MAG: GIY-YIG nuclease family protein [Fibrobacter sp.]|nr:GIY-YIG nuclease family protein [Fibrobacter sp.]
MNRTNDLKPFSTYILSNYNKTVLYIGITNDLKRRICEHKSKLDPIPLPQNTTSIDLSISSNFNQ